jgi:tRNA G10  N-methylase Trm11
MKYFFHLGNNPTLSIAEISAVFGYDRNYDILSENILIMENDSEIDGQSLIRRLGGTIKVGVIADSLKRVNTETLVEKISQMIKPSEGKFKFGISYYGHEKLNIKPVGMEIKKFLKEKDISCRWVISRDAILSSVVVGQNKLDTKGIEIVLIQKSNELLIGRTLAVQPFKELSQRDYGRPDRDDQSGMLPPKLAQIIINLARAPKDKTLLDPFCGSGTVLMEAMLMGYKKMVGSDISEKAVSDSKKNIEWTRKKFPISQYPNFPISQIDATALSKKIQSNSIDAIVTEPYLGPQRGKIEVKQTVRELENLYSKALREFEIILKRGGTIVMLFPVIYGGNFLKPDLRSFKVVSPLPENLIRNKYIKLTPRNTIVYGRPGQRVWREIVILEK